METSNEHTVIICFNKPLPYADALYETDDKLKDAIEKANAGYYDWHETDEDDTHGSFYMYGPDADKLFAAVKPAISTISFMDGAIAMLHYGMPGTGAKFKRIELQMKDELPQ